MRIRSTLRPLPLCLAFCAAPALAQSPVTDQERVLTQYVSPMQQTALSFGQRSHWLQPWRAYLETVPSARLRDAVGINLNVSPDEADTVCRHLAKNGFRRVRVEYGWGSVSWDDPTRLADPSGLEKTIGACRRYGLRPLFLLNAHHGAPCPARFFNVRLTAPARKGDRTVKLAPDSLAQLVPGRSGLSQLSDYWAAEALFTAIAPDGTATLSKPLPKDLPAGDAPAATLKYLPFYPSKLKSDGSVPPQFDETMAGWLDYVKAVTAAATRVLGTEGAADAGFDLEVWNELTFGSSFLSINNYYEKPIADGEWAPAEILRRTVAYVSDPAHGLKGVGVGDGFDNQWPWGAGSTAPPGLAALDKHPYAGVRRFRTGESEPGDIRPVDALGRPDGVNRAGKWVDTFVPTYVSHFPEYPLSAIQTEHIVRDISPITTDLYGVKHGRLTHPSWPDGKPAPAPGMWITEVNLDPNGADPGNLQAYTVGGQKPVAPGLGPDDAARMRAKATLRYLVSYVNKGVGRIYFYAAKDENPMGLGLVSNRFFQAVKQGGGAYPADDAPLTSPTMAAVRRLVAAVPAGGRLKPGRAIALLQIAETHGHRQFDGDPATAGQTPDPHPPLYNHDVLGFFPYQVADSRFVVGLYVMTRNMAQLYRPDAPATDPTRFDMPEERYRLTIGGLVGRVARVELCDPLDGRKVAARVLGTGAGRLIVDVPLTDSPRLLLLTEAAPAPAKPAARPTKRK